MNLKNEPSDALRPSLSARARLDDSYDHILDILGAMLADFKSFMGMVDHQHFIEQKPRDEHIRIITEIRAFDRSRTSDACFYIEHPVSGHLLPVILAIPCRRAQRCCLVWVADFDDNPIEVTPHHRCYISDEPDVAGKTLYQVIGRYANDNA